MKILSEVLKNENIFSKETLQSYIDNYSKNSPFTLINEKNKEEFFNKINTEGVIELNSYIIDLEKIEFDIADSIYLYNCIFTGKVIIKQNRESMIDCYFEAENSIFMKDLSFENIKKREPAQIALYNVNIVNLTLFNLKTQEVIIDRCRIFFITIKGINAKKLETENNKFEFFDIEDYNIDTVVFDVKQLNTNFINKILKSKFFQIRRRKANEFKMSIDLFDFIKFHTTKDIERELAINSLTNVLTFLKEKTEIENDKKEYNKILYWEIFLSQTDISRKFVIWLTGGFLQPGRFLLIGFVLYLIFSIIYTMPFISFSALGEMRRINILESLYFSGVTFTTVGYGDILPIGLGRFFAVSEAICGIIVMNTYMVALIKKYID